MRIAIIGGGASGLMAALCCREGVEVDIYEQNDEPGKKILASGNGRCNISNSSLSSSDYFGEHPSFVNRALAEFDFKRFERFCASIGLLLNIRDDGRVYPLSNEAKSVHEIFRSELERRGVRLLCGHRVEEVKKSGKNFLLKSNGSTESYDRLLVAAGSPAAPQLGGGRGGLQIAEFFGHRIVEPYPTLVGLRLKGSLHERMSGLKCEAKITLYVDSKRKEEIEGDLLFTRYGISGFGVLDISTTASIALKEGRRVVAGLNILPGFSRQALVSQLEKISKTLPDNSLFLTLHGILPKWAVLALLEYLKIDPKRAAGSLSPKEIRSIASTICDWRFEVEDTHGYRHAETAGGGVATDEVDPATMESKIVPGLYFSGEILDIVGRRGGYNLHFAWASGYLAGRSMSKSYTNPK